VVKILLQLLTLMMAVRDLLIAKGVFSIDEYNAATARATGKMDQLEAKATDVMFGEDHDGEG
jgi:hypothetical protein